MSKIDENTRLSAPIKSVSWIVGGIGVVAYFVAGLYAIPTRLERLEAKAELQKDMCKVLKRLQEIQVPKPYREDINCK